MDCKRHNSWRRCAEAGDYGQHPPQPYHQRRRSPAKYKARHVLRWVQPRERLGSQLDRPHWVDRQRRKRSSMCPVGCICIHTVSVCAVYSHARIVEGAGQRSGRCGSCPESGVEVCTSASFGHRRTTVLVVRPLDRAAHCLHLNGVEMLREGGRGPLSRPGFNVTACPS